MKKKFKRFVQCGALSFGVLCQESYSMTADVDLMEQGRAGVAARSASVAANQGDYDMLRVAKRSSLKIQGKSKMIGIGFEGDFEGIALYICLSSVCVVGGLSVLHLVGLI